MATQAKRKVSTAGFPTGGRTVKRRASKACACCRSRKVRCDVVESGLPCTNCRLDEVECIVTEGKRRRKPYADATHQSPCASIEDEKDLNELMTFEDIDGLNDLVPNLLAAQSIENRGGLDDDMMHHKPHMLYQTQGHRLSREECTRRMSVMKTQPFPSPVPAYMGSQYSPHTQDHLDIVLPAYIQPVPLRITNEDLEYLQKKGAFMVPDGGFRNELLRCYVQYVHPFMPIIDLQGLLTTVEKNHASDAVSLLLFQAVMFTGTAYIDMRYLTAQGYVTRKAARKAFFQKVKVLYDFDYEMDRVTIVQSILLMTYWYESPDEPKDVWYWLGLAIAVARTIGLHCDTSNAPLMTPKQRSLWKRIWWACYTRDRLLAIGMRRSMRINSGEFDVQMLELEDFETAALPQNLIRLLGGCPVVEDSFKRVTLAEMSIGLAKLCVCISQVLGVQYSTLGHKLGATQETTMRLIPRRTSADPAEVIRCDSELDQWYKDLPAELRYFAPNFRERTQANDGEVISLHRGLLTGIYLTAVSALHRPQILPSAPNIFIVPELREMSRRKVREAANSITDMYNSLYEHDMIRYLPNTGVTCLLPAIIIHLLDIKSADSETRRTSIRKFQTCMQSLQRLREMYASADFAFSFLDAAVRKTNQQAATAEDCGPLLSRPQSGDNGEWMDHTPISHSPPLLTPPPEAMRGAGMLLFSSTLAPDERNLISAYTPPKSDVSLKSNATGGTAVALLDMVEDLDDDMLDENGKFSENYFETLVNVEGCPDFFPAVDDFDANMQWLNHLDDDTNPEFSLEGVDLDEEHPIASGFNEQTVDVTR